MSQRLTLYSKPGCGLCEEARLHLAELAGEFDFEVDEVDITAQADLFARFRYVIPVIDIADGQALFAPISQTALREALSQPRMQATP